MSVSSDVIFVGQGRKNQKNGKACQTILGFQVKLDSDIIKIYNHGFCLACEAEARHMYCFSGGGVNLCRVFAFRSFSQKL